MNSALQPPEYKLVVSTSADDLMKKVNFLIDAGWNVSGGISAVDTTSKSQEKQGVLEITYAQAMLLVNMPAKNLENLDKAIDAMPGTK